MDFFASSVVLKLINATLARCAYNAIVGQTGSVILKESQESLLRYFGSHSGVV